MSRDGGKGRTPGESSCQIEFPGKLSDRVSREVSLKKEEVLGKNKAHHKSKGRKNKSPPLRKVNQPAEFYSPLKGLIFFEIRKAIDSFRSFFFTH